MSVYGRIIKVDKKSTLLWCNGQYTKIALSSKHAVGDIIDENDNLITKCHIKYDHKKDKKRFNDSKNKFLYIKKIKKFFEDAGFFEVITPKLKKSILMETNISLIKTPYGYLTPSPEVEIKKLISLGFDKIFELCFAYRDDYEDRLHKKEFLILEWYRPLETHKTIVDDFIELVKYLNNANSLRYNGLNIDLNRVEYVEYAELFLDYAGIDIEHFNEKIVGEQYGIEGNLSKQDVLDAVFALKIEKNLGLNHPVVVYNFPCQLAALSKVEDGYAKRFEMYIAGIELFNCYEEENNYEKIAERFDNTDDGFFEAIKKGIPAMSGIAVGVDRLIMLLENCKIVF